MCSLQMWLSTAILRLNNKLNEDLNFVTWKALLPPIVPVVPVVNEVTPVVAVVAVVPVVVVSAEEDASVVMAIAAGVVVVVVVVVVVTLVTADKVAVSNSILKICYVEHWNRW